MTITIGGNDIGFADVVKDCADPTKDCDGAFNLASSKLGPVLDNNLQSTYLDILQKAPLADVYVLGYPPLLAAGSSGCWVGNNGSSAPFFSADRIQKGVTLSVNLNTASRTTSTRSGHSAPATSASTSWTQWPLVRRSSGMTCAPATRMSTGCSFRQGTLPRASI